MLSLKLSGNWRGFMDIKFQRDKKKWKLVQNYVHRYLKILLMREKKFCSTSAMYLYWYGIFYLVYTQKHLAHIRLVQKLTTLTCVCVCVCVRVCVYKRLKIVRFIGKTCVLTKWMIPTANSWFMYHSYSHCCQLFRIFAMETIGRKLIIKK